MDLALARAVLSATRMMNFSSYRAQLCINLLAASLVGACVGDPGDLETTSTESAATVAQWLDDVQVPNQMSAREPGLAYYGGKLHMIHNGNTYPNDLWWSTFDGFTWSPNVHLAGFESDSGPALTPYAGKLFMAFHRPSENGIFLSTTTGTSWTTPSPLIQPSYVNIKHAPSVTVFGSTLQVASCFTSYANGHDGIMLDSFDGTTWSSTIVNTTMYRGTCEAVALQTINGQLHLLSTWHYTVSNWPYSSEWTPISEQVLLPAFADLGQLAMDSVHPPAMTTCNGSVFLVHSGDSNPSEIWWSYRPATGAGSWTTNERLTNQTSDSGSGIGCFDDVPIIVHNGGTNQLWWSSYR